MHPVDGWRESFRFKPIGGVGRSGRMRGRRRKGRRRGRRARKGKRRCF